MVGEHLEGTTLATVLGFTNANCLNVVGNDEAWGTTAARSATATGSTSPRWWSPATATASTGCGRGTRRHGRLGCCWVWQVSTKGDKGNEVESKKDKEKHGQNQVQIDGAKKRKGRSGTKWSSLDLV